MPEAAIPADDPVRHLTVRGADSPDAVHLSVAGGTYTLLVTGAETAGRYCLIDMHVPPSGGPPPHRHDFEEMFTVLDGELEFTFRGEKRTVGAGRTVNIPANAPHAFKNVADAPARLLCLCTPAGQDDFFLQVGDRVDTRTAPPPPLDDEEKAARMKKAQALAPSYRTELLPPESLGAASRPAR